MKFNEWIDTHLKEKGIDLNEVLTVDGPSGPNQIPVGLVVNLAKQAGPVEQSQVKDTLVKIDFVNGDPLHFFAHLAGSFAR